jgi:hypothetical protein
MAGGTAAEWGHSVGTVCENRAFRFVALALACCGAARPGNATATTPVVVPPGSLYVCVTESGGVRRQVPIEFSPNVGALCARHPEMGPCQYERNACRSNGGRVYAAGGIEVTLQMEADYDRKVLRVRIR